MVRCVLVSNKHKNKTKQTFGTYLLSKHCYLLSAAQLKWLSCSGLRFRSNKQFIMVAEFLSEDGENENVLYWLQYDVGSNWKNLYR